MRRLTAAAALALIAGLAWYAFMLRTTLVELHAALEEATSSVVQLSSELSVARQDADRLIDTLGVVGADEVVMVALRGQGVASLARGRAFVSQGHGVLLRVSGIDTAASGDLLHLWAVTGDGPVNLGSFGVNPFGAATLTRLLPADAGAVRAVWVTGEVGDAAVATDADLLLAGTLPAD